MAQELGVPVRPPGLERPYPKETKTGKVPFEFPKTGIKGETAYYLWGDLSSGKTPLILLHGGPGMSHNYLRPISLIASDYGIPVLTYDQIGCGASSHFPDKRGDCDFWTPEMFMAELDNLKSQLGIDEFDLLGQSWGGMLGADYAIRQPRGLRKLIIADSTPSMALWLESAARLRKRLPADVQETLDRCEKEGRTDSDEYEKAVMVFYGLFVCRIETWPEDLNATFELVKQDGTVYETMNGPSEFHVIGCLKTWDIVGKLREITDETCPGGVLLVNGYYDEAEDVIMDVFFRKISAKMKWYGFALSSHLPHLEEAEKYLAILGSFLTT